LANRHAHERIDTNRQVERQSTGLSYTMRGNLDKEEQK